MNNFRNLSEKGRLAGRYGQVCPSLPPWVDRASKSRAGAPPGAAAHAAGADADRPADRGGGGAGAGPPGVRTRVTRVNNNE